MASLHRRAVRVAGLASLACLCLCLSLLAEARAETGACGLETGTWTTVARACAYAERPDEAARRFGENALLEWGRGFYRFQGAHCTIFADKLNDQRCTLRVECASQRARTMAEWDIEIETAHRLRFGTRADSPVYALCGDEKAPR